MELKTKVNAEAGRQDLTITREFDISVDLLFKAHADADIVAQVMGTKVLKFEGKKQGGYQFETTDANGNIVFKANGTFHEFTPDKKIIRTFEMDNAPFGVQLEVYEFEKLTDQTSKLNIHVIYESGALRDALLKMPFAQGLNYAHNRLEDLLKTSK
jgi:uncharacterized protein YndB with AHSA1/START domain